MPWAAGLRCTASFSRIMTHGEKFVGCFVTVSCFASAHRGVSVAVEYGWDGLLFEIRRASFGAPRRRWEVPNRATTHDHMPGRHAHGSGERTHVIGTIENHTASRELVDIGSVQCGTGVVDLQIKRRLVVDKDKDEVGTRVLRCICCWAWR